MILLTQEDWGQIVECYGLVPGRLKFGGKLFGVAVRTDEFALPGEPKVIPITRLRPDFTLEDTDGRDIPMRCL